MPQLPPSEILLLVRPHVTPLLIFAAIAVALGGEWTSWWRSEQHNRSVGGHPQSQHLLALAVDIVMPSRELTDLMLGVASLLGRTAIDEGDHVHAQLFPAGTIPASLFQRFGLL